MIDLATFGSTNLIDPADWDEVNNAFSKGFADSFGGTGVDHDGTTTMVERDSLTGGTRIGDTKVVASFWFTLNASWTGFDYLLTQYDSGDQQWYIAVASTGEIWFLISEGSSTDAVRSVSSTKLVAGVETLITCTAEATGVGSNADLDIFLGNASTPMAEVAYGSQNIKMTNGFDAFDGDTTLRTGLHSSNGTAYGQTSQIYQVANKFWTLAQAEELRLQYLGEGGLTPRDYQRSVYITGSSPRSESA